MNIKIEGINYSLKFGYGFLRKFGEFYSMDNYPATIELIEKELGSFETLTFRQEDILLNFFYYAAVNAQSENVDNLKDVDILTFVTSESKVLENVFDAFRKSFPQNEGKPQPRKPARKSVKITKKT